MTRHGLAVFLAAKTIAQAQRQLRARDGLPRIPPVGFWGISEESSVGFGPDVTLGAVHSVSSPTLKNSSISDGSMLNSACSRAPGSRVSSWSKWGESMAVLTAQVQLKVLM